MPSCLIVMLLVATRNGFNRSNTAIFITSNEHSRPAGRNKNMIRIYVTPFQKDPTRYHGTVSSPMSNVYCMYWDVRRMSDTHYMYVQNI